MKDVLSQGEGEFVLCRQGERGFQMRDCGRPHILVQKLRIFQNLWCVRTNMGEGVETAVRTLFGQEGRNVNFSRFCVDVFYGRPLKTFSAISYGFVWMYVFANDLNL